MLSGAVLSGAVLSGAVLSGAERRRVLCGMGFP
ncbi:pentapeptide repeat-containing protein [Blastococcus sp. TML/C7B]|nr:pentapeptide repeat-containing protein [Blastococcus sp. TML/C7B]